MPRAWRPSHCPAGTRPAPRAHWLSRLLVYSLVRGDQKGNWSRMTHNRCFFQQEQHFWRPRELSLGPSTFAKDPFPGVHAAPHWLAARRPHPGFAPQPQHQAGGQLSPPHRPPRPLVRLGKAPWVQGASSGQEERPCCGKSHEEAEATGQAPAESPKASAASVASAPRTEEAKPAIPWHLDSSQQTGSVQEESKAKAHCVE